jgi:hypothetical protein
LLKTCILQNKSVNPVQPNSQKPRSDVRLYLTKPEPASHIQGTEGNGTETTRKSDALAMLVMMLDVSLSASEHHGQQL